MPVTSPNPAADFEALGRQVWDAWSRPWAGPAAAPSAAAPMPGMDGLKGYFDWMRQAAAAMTGQGGPVASPVAPFGNWTLPGTGMPPLGLDALRGMLDTPAFGHNREQQAQQQALMRALLDHQQASARYHELLARAQAQGAERMQRKLVEPGFQVASLKAVYDLWVDAVEEAYAEIALSDEFREAYAAQGNTQMRVRQLQQQQMEQWCREAGLPTRSEVATLGQRVQELRRELRRMQAAGAAAPSQVDGKAVKTPKRQASAKPARGTQAQSVAKPAPGTRAKSVAKAASRRTSRKPR